MLSERGHHEQFERNDFQIKDDDKFYSRVMSKESSMANCSCRVYYGGVRGTVPFMWESQPGTPKHPSSDTVLPPLTPPPSYHSSCTNSKSNHKKMKSSLFSSIFPRRKNQGYYPSSSSSSSSLSSYSMSHNLHRKSCFPCSRSPVHNFMLDFEEEDEGISSPTSTLCFGRNLNHMKKALLSMVTPAPAPAPARGTA